MERNLKAGILASFVLGAVMLWGGRHFRATGALPSFQSAGLAQVIATGAVLCAAAALCWLLRRQLEARLSSDAAAPAAGSQRYLTLFLASFVALFVEVMLIRYTGSQIRIFAFYKNVPLVSCFLGLGLGCCLGSGRSRHALTFLLGLLPLAVFLAQGSLLVDGYLSAWTAEGSSEHVLGDTVVVAPTTVQVWASQLLMGAFCVAMLTVVTTLFVLIGRLLGGAFEELPRLPAYTVNILGSLAGILAFVALSYLQTPPWVWFLVGLAPLLWWVDRRGRALASGLVLLNVAAVAPDYGNTVWSPYQKLVGHHVLMGANDGRPAPPAYLVQISDVFYQVAVDLRPAAVAQLGRNPFPHYDGIYQGIDRPDRVLVVGAGTGNDVAAALRAGVSHVDAVDIDPAILDMGRDHHPESPYADPRVNIIVDDARRAFRRLEPGTYDAIVFGLLDSHTQLGMSSVRLDNYVFTLESFRAARRLLKPGGYLLVTAASFRDWFRERLAGMLQTTCGDVLIKEYQAWWTYSCQVTDPDRDPAPLTPLAVSDLPSDNWPFLYLPNRSIPRAYLVVIALLVAASLLILKMGGLELGRFTLYHRHLFFLGAAFLLMEVYAINRLALLFGTTWLVSAVTIALVLTLIVCGNLTVGLFGNVPYGVAYLGLIATLLGSYFLDPASVLGRGPAFAIAYGLFVLSPIFFAALVFARSFKASQRPGEAIGFNILGSVLGGWVEYATMATGIRSMVLLALVFYAVSFLALRGWRRSAEL